MNAEYIHTVADAIRKNGLKQTYGDWVKYDYSDDIEGKIVGACALGQAGINLDTSGYRVMANLNTTSDSQVLTCPSKGICWVTESKYQTHLGDMVMHLNDRHRWKFSTIAKYLDKVAENG